VVDAPRAVRPWFRQTIFHLGGYSKIRAGSSKILAPSS
jgi:hypothetical protein